MFPQIFQDLLQEIVAMRGLATILQVYLRGQERMQESLDTACRFSTSSVWIFILPFEVQSSPFQRRPFRLSGLSSLR